MDISTYSHMLERVMPQEVHSVIWSNTMDVCAILYSNNHVEVCRVSEQLQRMFMISETEPIQTILVESAYLFITAGSKLSVHYLPSHQKIISTNLNKNSEIIRSIQLIPVQLKQIKQTALMAPIQPLQNTNIKNWQHLSFLRSEQQNNLVVAQHESNISISLNGFQHIIDIQVRDVQFTRVFHNELHLYTSEALKVFDISALTNQFTLKHSQSLAYLNELLSFMKNSITSINTQLADIYKVFQLNIIGPLQKVSAQEPINAIIMEFYQFGQCPKELAEFFSKELYNTKIVQKMDEKMSASFNQIQDILQDSLLNVISTILIELDDLKSLADIPYYTGVQGQYYNELHDRVSLLHSQLIRFQLESHESKLHLRNFFVWLNKCAIKSTNEADQECENVISPLNKLELDLSKLYQFISDEHLFTLKNLQCFFNDKIQMKSYFTKEPIKRKLNQQKSESVTKALQTIFKGLYNEPEFNEIECETTNQTFPQYIRQIQNSQENNCIKIPIQQLKEIKLNYSLLTPCFSQDADAACKSYKFFVIKDNAMVEFEYQDQQLRIVEEIKFQALVIKEVKYYLGEPIIIFRNPSDSQEKHLAIISSKDLQTQNRLECHNIHGLSISKKGLLSVIIDYNKMLILAL